MSISSSRVHLRLHPPRRTGREVPGCNDHRGDAHRTHERQCDQQAGQRSTAPATLSSAMNSAQPHFSLPAHSDRSRRLTRTPDPPTCEPSPLGPSPRACHLPPCTRKESRRVPAPASESRLNSGGLLIRRRHRHRCRTEGHSRPQRRGRRPRGWHRSRSSRRRQPARQRPCWSSARG